MELDAILTLLALAVALALRPWRMLTSARPLVHEAHGTPAALWTPLLATLVLLPWLWALPHITHMPLQLQWSGACLVLLMLGWPLAVPVLCTVGGLAWLLAPALTADEALSMVLWHGIVPATLALGWGVLLRRWVGTRVFVYIFGRGFVGTALSLFAASLLAQALGESIPGISQDLGKIARWLMAWGDAIVTGMTTAIFVAYRPQWLATWSDRLYLAPPPPDPGQTKS